MSNHKPSKQLEDLVLQSPILQKIENLKGLNRKKNQFFLGHHCFFTCIKITIITKKQVPL